MDTNRKYIQTVCVRKFNFIHIAFSSTCGGAAEVAPTSIQCLPMPPPIQLSSSAAKDCSNCHLQLIACFCGPASTGAGTRGKYCDHLSREQDAEVALIDSRCSIMHPRLYCCCDFSLHQPQPPTPIWQKVYGYQFIGNFEHAMKPSLLVVCSVRARPQRLYPQSKLFSAS